MIMAKIKFNNGRKTMALSIQAIDEKTVVELGKQRMSTEFPEFKYRSFSVETLRLLQEG